jgi:hypothetical protein
MLNSHSSSSSNSSSSSSSSMVLGCLCTKNFTFGTMWVVDSSLHLRQAP